MSDCDVRPNRGRKELILDGDVGLLPVLVARLLGNLGLVIAAGVRSHVWSVFQARHLFPALFPLLLMLGSGLWPAWRSPAGRVLVGVSVSLLVATFLAYHVAVIAALSG